MGASTASKRARSRIHDSGVALLLLLAAVAACGAPTRAAVRRSTPEKNLERLSDERSWVREEAALALGAATVPAAASPLEALVADRNERAYVRAAAARALGGIRAASSLGVLTGVAAERGAPAELALALVEALCQYRDDTAVQAIEPLVHHDDLRVATVARREVDARCVH